MLNKKIISQKNVPFLTHTILHNWYQHNCVDNKGLYSAILEIIKLKEFDISIPIIFQYIQDEAEIISRLTAVIIIAADEIKLKTEALEVLKKFDPEMTAILAELPPQEIKVLRAKIKRTDKEKEKKINS